MRVQFLAALSAPDASLVGLTATMSGLLAGRCAAADRPAALDTELVARMLGRIMSHDDVIYLRVRLLFVATSPSCAAMLIWQQQPICRGMLRLPAQHVLRMRGQAPHNGTLGRVV